MSGRSESAFRIGVASVWANVLPMAVLWCVSVTAVLSYYFVPGAAVVFEPLMRWQTTGSWVAAFLNRVVFLAVLPGVFLLSVRSIRPPRPHWVILAYALWGGAWGVFDDVFFTRMAHWFGDGADIKTLLLKTLVGQLVGTILVGLIPGFVFFRWVACDFSWSRLRGEWPRHLFRVALPSLLVANWIVWIPVNICTYAFPLPLQIQLVGLAGCFWMLVGLQTGVRNGRRTERSAA